MPAAGTLSVGRGFVWSPTFPRAGRSRSSLYILILEGMLLKDIVLRVWALCNPVITQIDVDAIDGAALRIDAGFDQAASVAEDFGLDGHRGAAGQRPLREGEITPSSSCERGLYREWGAVIDSLKNNPVW